MLVCKNITYKDVLCNIVTQEEFINWYFEQPTYQGWCERPKKMPKRRKNIFRRIYKDANVTTDQGCAYSDDILTNKYQFV